MALQDIRLHLRVKNDDVDAFEVIFKTYYSELVSYANSFLNDIDASEEIVQELFYNYWKNRKRITIKLSMKSYLYRSVRNNSLNYLDSVAVRRKYAERVMDASSENQGYENSDVEMAELNQFIEDILDELPARTKKMFMMSRFEGLKYEEIARELSVSVKTVEANMSKALKLLRERLGDQYNI